MTPTRRGPARVPAALGALKRALYRGGRPGRVARLWNRVDAALYAAGVGVPRQAATLEVVGRVSGRPVTTPVAVADVDGVDHLVSMLGPRAGWVRNVEASGGRAVLHRRGHAVPVRLEPVPVAARPPVLRRYAAVAPGARPHLGVGKSPTPAELARIAPEHPVFRVVPDPEKGPTTGAVRGRVSR